MAKDMGVPKAAARVILCDFIGMMGSMIVFFWVTSSLLTSRSSFLVFVFVFHIGIRIDNY